MSVLVVDVTSHGIIFAADRNVTWQTHHPDGEGHTIIEVHGQTQRPKVLRWPARKALVGYVGMAQVGGVATDEWLYDFIGEHVEFANLEELAEALKSDIESQCQDDLRDVSPDQLSKALIVHLAGFEEREGTQVPIVWYVRNAHRMEDGKYTDIRKEFKVSEELWGYYPGVKPSEIRDVLQARQESVKPFWFHQTGDLSTFNAVGSGLVIAFRLMDTRSAADRSPHDLQYWERRARMEVLTYGAYFETFKGPGEQLVGGGVDSVTIPWPETGPV